MKGLELFSNFSDSTMLPWLGKQVDMRSTIRKFSTWLLAGIAIAVIGQFFIQVAQDKGWYTRAGHKWDVAMTFLLSSWTLYPATLLAGFVVGLWVDAILAKRERKPLEEEAQRHYIDRLALALEAEILSREIAALAGAGQARAAIAWQEDTSEMISRGPEEPRRPTRDRSVSERAKIIEKYGEKYHADAWRIIDAAGRLMPLDRNDVWQVSHLLHGGYDIDKMSSYLMRIANGLRYPNEPQLPEIDKQFPDQA
ncbi:MAG: hypothetical protein K2P68_05480 [Sphingomonas sp.]|nr:hypothetical protein [Sphingomonas sp.]